MIQDSPNLYALHGSFVDTTNDSWAHSRDDYLTGAIRGRIDGEHVYLNAALDILTWRLHSRRTDQASLIVGGVLPHLHIGAGAVVDGDLAGQEVQSAIHRSTGKKLILGEYPGRYHVEPAISAEANVKEAYLILSATPKSLQVTPMLRVGASTWEFGIGYAYYHGTELSPVARRVAESMTGPRVTAGTTYHGFALGVEISGVTTLASMGMSL